GAIVHRRPNTTTKKGDVYEQGTVAGARVNKGTKIDIYVSNGPPLAHVPDVMGKSNNDAIAAIVDAKLKFKVLQVFSKEPGGTVVAQSPRGGKIVNQGSIVHINVSKGLQPLDVPDVRGQLFDNAAGALQGAGFSVVRNDVDSSQPKDTVIDQDPRGGASLARGGTVTLFVSKGPKQTTVPDVSSQDEDSARQVLQQSGFSVDVQDQDTTDPNQDGIVLSQDPVGGTKAKPGTTVTIVVGRLVPP